MSIHAVCKKSFIALILIYLFLSLGDPYIISQSLISGAESVAYHSGTDCYYVSSLSNNKVIKLNSDGNESLFKEITQNRQISKDRDFIYLLGSIFLSHATQHYCLAVFNQGFCIYFSSVNDRYVT